MKTIHLKIKATLTEICWQDSPSSISELFKHRIEQKRNGSNGFSWNQFNQLICLFFSPRSFNYHCEKAGGIKSQNNHSDNMMDLIEAFVSDRILGYGCNSLIPPSCALAGCTAPAADFG